MSGGDIDINGMGDEEVELLMRRLEERKRAQRGKTPDLSYSPQPAYPQEPARYRQDLMYPQEQPIYRQEPPTYFQDPVYREEQPSYRRDPMYPPEPTYRQEYTYRQEATYRQNDLQRGEPVYRQERPDRTPYRNHFPAKIDTSRLTADSDSDDLESLESFLNSNLNPDLPDEEWLFVSPVCRPSEQQRRVRVSDWLRMGSEDEFDGVQSYKTQRRAEYRMSPPHIAALSRYKSPPQGPPVRSQSPLDALDILKMSGVPSRYTEQMGRRSFSPPAPYPELQRDLRDLASSPSDPALRRSPDWTRESVVSPSRGAEQTSGYRFSPQATTGNPIRRHDSPGLPARETPSPKLSGGPPGSPQRMSGSYHRTGPRPPPGEETHSLEKPTYVPSTTPDRERQPRRDLPQSRGVTPPQIGRPGIRPPGLIRPSAGIRAPQAPSGLRQPRSALPNPALSRAPFRPDS